MPTPLYKRLGASSGLSAANKAWLSRILAAGGTRPSSATFRANDKFLLALNTAGILNSIKVANLFVPDNLTAAITPFIQTTGFNSWTNPGSGGLVSDLTSAGLAATGSGTRFIRTNIFPGNFMTSGSGHMAAYVSADDISTTQEECGCLDTGLNDTRLFYHTGAGNTGCYFYEQSNPMNWASGVGTLTGYVCVSRTTTTQCNIYFANSGSAHASKLSNTTAESHTPSTTNDLFVFGTNNNGGGLIDPSKKRLSFMSWGLGLSASDSLALFNAVQNFRMAIGGGFS